MYPYPLFFGYGDLALLVLRVVLGIIFVVHGWSKIADLKKNSEAFRSMGFRPGAFWGTLAALLEFFGGIAFIFGIFTSALAFLFAAQFLVIILWRLGKRHHFVGGWEFDLLIFASLLLFISLGAGHFVFDRMLFPGY